MTTDIPDMDLDEYYNLENWELIETETEIVMKFKEKT